MNHFSKVLNNPLKIKDIVIPNRIVFPPIVTGYSNADGSIGDRQRNFYKTIAQGGVGLVIIGATAVAEDGLITMRCSRIDKDDYIKDLSELFDSIKAEGSVAGIQLVHAGRQTNTRRTGGLPTVAPSAIPCPISGVMPRELNIVEIKNLENAFAQATERALEAGADFIEYHAAHGYLINQFLSPFSNKRADEYGGSLENRARFALNIIKGARERVGVKPVLGFRISAVEFIEGGFTLEEAKKVCQWMVDHGSDFVHVSAGISAVEWEIRSREMEKGTFIQLAASIKEVVDVPIICVGAITSLKQAEGILVNGFADLVAMGRALIADPRLITKTLQYQVDSIVDCDNCRNCLHTIMDDEGNGMECSQNPDLP
ncbi:MAG: oxidoreductase [Planctomycetota bacterium]|jgi:2,4-dienoyl-CoA reductase-like NADH-dependent reductase (Old Yellow Enzyme family)